MVSNGAYIDSASADGLRKSLAEEFAAIYCLNLRGNQRTSGETSRREGGKIFGQGSRAPIAVTLLVRDPDHVGPATIHYHDIGDYLSREDKLARLTAFGDVSDIPWQEITPNAAGDWVNQRGELFETCAPLGDKAGRSAEAVFETYSLGVVTNRDAWAYNFSRDRPIANMDATIGFYEAERSRLARAVGSGVLPRTDEAVNGFVNTDPSRISWTRGLKHDLRLDKPAAMDAARAVASMYRPFCKQWLYFDRQWNEMVLKIPSLFPTPGHANRVIAVSGSDSSALMTNLVPNLHLVNTNQCFPRYRYVEVAEQGSLFATDGRYERHDAISARALDAYRARYGAEVCADDIFDYVYGLLHSPEYRERFAPELGKMIPRLPMVDAFFEFAQAGGRLGELHLGYESVDPWPLEGLPSPEADPASLRVEKMRFAGNARSPDHSTIVVNSSVALGGIPEEAHRYEVNGRTALEWILDRYQVKIDAASGIRNDPNDWSADPRYIVDLVARIVRVSVDSAAIIDELPQLRL